MARDNTNIKPTEAELTLLNVLWKVGPATVRQVHDVVSKTQKTGYTTVLKILQIMHEKTLVIRDESNRAHVYAPSNSETFTQSSLLKDLASKAFGGSTSKLVMRALDESTSKEEIADIRQLLNELEK
ncbi:MAG: BlaI family penicillinase repressor [Colwellia sp.]|jgi:predicted transcriptional regulator|uniref:BlaI/MecI/CopY family transcriptional regulator n=1 Tax=unclassified Colwellia TaxID=196834 RepID=UPI00087854A3|nr:MULTISPECIES: BlaI/MecI/CopY family transcriptional regulator [unclassified Colwellia]AOW77035.1 transcriptional regulator [Colwellia sp. PAMC 20917]MBA6252546.1 BlaI/MecI/CopY family transcriptional regulator [Colwellia sp. MB3u-55]MBA6336455.1 BlaI/MecI/CopY family transcriptional regulator [Colwellia sp. BRX8-7]MBA6348647.1 BlaI/MecI/CopY family transcriptional regulator [Colwellia sp. BRX8-9]MBA6352842.1 BlaI/MecI/CopY family transcriptional regulator [Colwellia sp. BRX9-1]|tara:strand:+ start:822 stop:1202 length:381 start_codon:yes stop_codon:yes gene_type:complete